jgi:RNase adaptor protein for sRNA GlmZ degradation
MSMADQEILLEYDDEERNCHAMLDAGKALGLGTTHREALEDLREAAHYYINTMIDLKLRELNQEVPAEGREENGNIRTETSHIRKYRRPQIC